MGIVATLLEKKYRAEKIVVTHNEKGKKGGKLILHDNVSNDIEYTAALDEVASLAKNPLLCTFPTRIMM
jgi:hypothetical protein